MLLTKKHQYKYLTEKLKFKYLDLKYREEILLILTLILLNMN